MDPVWREIGETLAKEQADHPRSLVMTEGRYNNIVKYIKDNSSLPTTTPENVRERKSCREILKRNKFVLKDIPLRGLTDALVAPNKRGDQVPGSSPFLLVLHSGNLVDTAYNIHVEELKHAGYKKTLDFVQKHYYGIVRRFLQPFIKKCPTCQLSAPHTYSLVFGRAAPALVGYYQYVST